MFENLIANLRTGSSRITESLSVEGLKQKTGRLSETLDNLRCSVFNKTNSLSSYLSEVKGDPGRRTKTSRSTPNLNQQVVRRMDLEEGVARMEWHRPPTYEECDPPEPDIIDRFVRVVNTNDDYHYSWADRRNDREEIRRRLATGSDADDYYGGDRPGRKPSLQARLQSGMNLQICFMNETMSDSESPCTEAPPSSNVANTTPTLAQLPPAKPKTIIQDPVTQTTVITAKKNSQLLNCSRDWQMDGTGGSFFERQARLQAEARVALAQAKELARMQMQTERQRQQTSPITSMLRASLNKVGIAFPDGRRRVSRQMLTDMNVAQLQVIVNDLHTQIERKFIISCIM
ncbi:hypothetical protein AAG570_001481 [Ranatra chinensis]|uniref:Schwannomin interacting protein 1 C-terminal domain-containing protein n=1 Tax=Ranatra chinensis TaxID=642074 RepID=A0ABD0Y8M3_9HEMI